MSVDQLVTDQLLTYLTGARWFSGKGRRTELRGLTPLPWLASPADRDPAVRFEIAEVGYPDEPEQAPDHYLLGLAYRSAERPELTHARIGEGLSGSAGVAYDALQDPDACTVILRALLDAGAVSDDGGRVTFSLTQAGGLRPNLVPQVYTGQQSNTSVMYGDVAMIKFFRRLELGRNLDIEVHAALNRAGVADVAQLFGWISADWTTVDGDPVSTDLAMAVEKLAGAEDGWQLALDSIPGAGFVQHAHALGVALAETHHALSDAFPTIDLVGADLAAVMAARLDRARAVAGALEPYADGLRRCFAALDGVVLPAQRVHGDFHLGQTLHTPGGWKIIDFEGEPAKSLAERRAPDSVWRDIAGMLRSFDYAAASVPGPEGAGWAAECRRAFLTGYAGGELSTADAALLRAYEADKAVYEVVYEVRNRPDWVGIPLGALARLAGAPTSADAASSDATAEQE